MIVKHNNLIKQKNIQARKLIRKLNSFVEHAEINFGESLDLYTSSAMTLSGFFFLSLDFIDELYANSTLFTISTLTLCVYKSSIFTTTNAYLFCYDLFLYLYKKGI